MEEIQNQETGGQQIPPVTSAQDVSQSEMRTSNQVSVPNSTGILVMGIISIAVFWCYGIFSIALSIIVLVLAGKGKRLYRENPSAFTVASVKNMNAGKICAIIGLGLAGLMILYLILVLVVFGALFSSMPWDSYSY